MSSASTEQAPLHLLFRMAAKQLRARSGLATVAAFGVALGVIGLVVTSSLLWGAKLQFESIILRVSPEITVKELDHTTSKSMFELQSQGVAVETMHFSPSSRTKKTMQNPAEILDQLSRTQEVVAVSSVLSQTGLLRFGSAERAVEVRGILPADEERVKPLSDQVVQGDWWSLGREGHRVAIGSGLSRQFGIVVGDSVRLINARGNTMNFVVAAVFESRVTVFDDTRVYAALSEARQLAGDPHGISEFSVRLQDAQRAREIAADISTRLGLDARSWQQQNANFLSLLAVQRKIGVVLLASVVLLSAFGILAVQIMVVMQKRRDIAILRSIGFQARDIMLIFVAYGLMMALTGAVFGISVAKLLVLYLKTIRVHMEGVTRGDSLFVVDLPMIYLLGGLFALFAGLLASLIPAYTASKVEPVSVLREQSF